MLRNQLRRFIEFVRDEDGPTAVEYAVIASAIAAFLVLSVGQVTLQMKSSFNNSGNVIGNSLNP